MVLNIDLSGVLSFPSNAVVFEGFCNFIFQVDCGLMENWQVNNFSTRKWCIIW